MQNLTILASAVPDITGATKYKMGHVTLTTPLVVRGLALATISVPIKFKVYISDH